jgi:hypothetical protein
MSRNPKLVMIFSMALLTISGVGSTCQTPKNPNDMSPPKAEIKVRGSEGPYIAMSSTNLSVSSSEGLDLLCLISDPDGVKSVRLSFSADVDSCTVGGTIYSGGYSISPPVPSTLAQTLEGDPSENVLNKLPLFAAVRGPFTCNVPHPPAPGPGPSQGAPYGSKIIATCSGHNWSSNPGASSAQTTLTIRLQ